ncbi:BlaI/MecI/CopY family transcriptional regulator [Sphingomonas sp.]|uniref:BlaI/MecI/CopY family transcriptional regulator n=1 Tax=Sphingomonas sp. TaxID=28214 RepID=UPI002ED8DA37
MIESLPRREREVFEILCGLEEATAAGVRNAMSDAPSDSAVRTLLMRLAGKGLVTHRTINQAYVYSPAPKTEAVAETALQKLVQTFFQGSAASAATALLGMQPRLKADEIDALQRVIDQARKEAE